MVQLKKDGQKKHRITENYYHKVKLNIVINLVGDHSINRWSPILIYKKAVFGGELCHHIK